MQKGGGAAALRMHTGRRWVWAWALAAAVALHLLLLGAWGGAAQRKPWGQRKSHQALPPAPLWARLLEAPQPPPSSLPLPPQPPVVPSGPVAQQAPVDRPASPPQAGSAALAGESAANAQPEPSAERGPTPVPQPGGEASPLARSAQRPVLATRPPLPFDQALQVRRGSQSGQGRWSWSIEKGRYRTELQAGLGGSQDGRGAATLNWSSQGGWDEHGVAPERFLTQPLRGGARAVNFQRDTGRVSYSGPTGQSPLMPGAQDRLSWLVQLLALVQAQPPGRGLPAELPIWVAGPQGDGGDWWFQVRWEPSTQCWRFMRRAERRYEVQVQVWVTGAGGPQARLVRLEMGHEGSRQAPWLLTDAAEPSACGHLP